MTEPAKLTVETIQVVAYDPTWPQIYLAQRALVEAAAGQRCLAFEHVGSTAVPGLDAKPIIDMMAAVACLSEGVALAAKLTPLGYRLIETGMPNRIFLRKYNPAPAYRCHLHVVEYAQAKTSLIQSLVDQARDERGLPRMSVWEA